MKVTAPTWLARLLWVAGAQSPDKPPKIERGTIIEWWGRPYKVTGFQQNLRLFGPTPIWIEATPVDNDREV